MTGGTGVPASASVNYGDPLVDNTTFAMVFDITADGSGAFQLTNTAGLEQSAINGFILEVPDSRGRTPSPLDGGLADAAASTGLEIPDDDGVANGVEFFMGGDPRRPGRWSRSRCRGGTCTFTIRWVP